MARILVIDDEADIRTIFQRCLERMGYTVETAADGRQGLRLLASTVPDLVITDLMMPEMDGLEVIRNIRNIRKQQPDLPIIAISGGMRTASANFLPIAGKFGANCVFDKPVELDQLLAAVRKLLGAKAPPA